MNKILLIALLLTSPFGLSGQVSPAEILERTLDEQRLLPNDLWEEKYHDEFLAILENHEFIPDDVRRLRYYHNIVNIRNACSNPQHRIPLTKFLLIGCSDGSKWLREFIMDNLRFNYHVNDFDSKNLLLLKSLFENEKINHSFLYQLALDLPLPEQHQMIKDKFQSLLKYKDVKNIDKNVFDSAKALASRGDERAIGFLLELADYYYTKAEKKDIGGWIRVTSFLLDNLADVPQRPITDFFIERYIFSDYAVNGGDWMYSDCDAALNRLQWVIAELSTAMIDIYASDDWIAAARQWFAENRDTYTYADWVKPRKKK